MRHWSYSYWLSWTITKENKQLTLIVISRIQRTSIPSAINMVNTHLRTATNQVLYLFTNALLSPIAAGACTKTS